MSENEGLDVLVKDEKTGEIELGGKVYRLGEITMGDMSEFEYRAKKKLRSERPEQIALAKEAYGEGKIPADVFRSIVSGPTRAQVEAETATIEGAAFMLYRAIKHYDPGIAEATVMDMIKLKDIGRVLEAMGLEANEEGGGGKNSAAPGASQ